MAKVEVKRTRDGRIFARRNDGQPLTPEDREAAKKLANEIAPAQEPTDPADGPIVAVLIDSPIVGPVWFALDDGWKSGDDVPVFYASEIPLLQKMSGEELRKRYEQKLAMKGGWIRERIEEPTRH
jgi:hypothetical protein